MHSAGQKPSDERTSAAKAASAHEDLVARERSDARAAEIRAKEAEVDKCKQQIASLTKQSSQLDELKGSELINAVSQMQHIDPSLDKILPKYQENVSTEAQLLNSGLGPNHPKIKSLNAERGVYMQQITDRILSIRRSLAIQLQIARNTAETLDTQPKKLRTEPDTASQDR